MKGISTEGVPCGTRCLNICWLLFFHPLTIRINQKTKARGRFTERCDEREKFCGKSAMIFIKIIREKIVMIIRTVPFSVFPNVKLTSFEKV
jgi:hypothetical protein